MPEPRPTLGQLLQQARLRKNVTASQAAAATRMKVQHVEALERDDFRSIAAPMYAKGFIRLYAEYLGLDPAPLIREYVERHAAAPPPLTTRKVLHEKPPLVDATDRADPAAPPAGEPAAGPRPAPRAVRLGVGAVVLVLLLLGLGRCAFRRAPAGAGPAPDLVTRPVIQEPPEPYLPPRPANMP